MDALDQIGDTVIDALAAYFKEKHNLGIVERLTRQVRIQEPRSPQQHAVAGKTVVFTGSLEKDDARGGQGDGRAAWREDLRLGVEEDRLRGRGPGRRIQARQGARGRRHGFDRRRVV
jgi:hypothetical protein